MRRAPVVRGAAFMNNATGSTTTLWLLRHPEPEESARGRCYGSLDVGLSTDGIRHAGEVAIALAMEPLAAIYSSPRRRCLEAAVKLAEGRSCQVEIVDAFREMDFGEFEGKTYDKIAAVYPEIYRQWMERPTETRFPGGESFGDMVDRVAEAENNLRRKHAGQSIAIMTHGGVIRIMLARALGIDLANVFRIGQRYGAINVIRYFRETPAVELLNGPVSG